MLSAERGVSLETSTEGQFFIVDTIGLKATTRTVIECHDVGQAALVEDAAKKGIKAN